MNIEVQVVNPASVWVAGKDSIESLRSRELNEINFIDDKRLSHEDFKLAMSRLRGRSGSYRVITGKFSKTSKWLEEWEAMLDNSDV